MNEQALQILEINPGMGIPGGVVSIRCRGFRPGLPSEARVLVGNLDAALVSASADLVIVRLPDNPQAIGLSLDVAGRQSPLHPFSLASTLADGLHPVGNPVVAPDGSLITTISGSRGQQVPQPLIRVTREGQKQPYGCEIMNPTGLAFGPDGQLYISSRSEGVVYRYMNFESLEPVAENLGVCCGIAFDSEGRLYAGDRTGKIHRIGKNGCREEFAELEPSISAYHLAFDPQDCIYVTGPTVSVRDALYRIDPEGKVSVVVSGLARPQGIAFGPDGSLWIAASYGGKKGVFKYIPESGRLEHCVAAPTLVGLAMAGEDIFFVDNNTVYWLRNSLSSRRLE